MPDGIPTVAGTMADLTPPSLPPQMTVTGPWTWTRVTWGDDSAWRCLVSAPVFNHESGGRYFYSACTAGHEVFGRWLAEGMVVAEEVSDPARIEREGRLWADANCRKPECIERRKQEEQANAARDRAFDAACYHISGKIFGASYQSLAVVRAIQDDNRDHGAPLNEPIPVEVADALIHGTATSEQRDRWSNVADRISAAITRSEENRR